MSNIKREWLGDRNLVRDLAYVFAQLSLLGFQKAEPRDVSPTPLSAREKANIRRELRAKLKASVELEKNRDSSG